MQRYGNKDMDEFELRKLLGNKLYEAGYQICKQGTINVSRNRPKG